MTLKEEIKNRLRQREYKRITKELFGDKAFEDLNENEYKQILKLADRYGSKYKQFYKLINDDDIKTITSNLNQVTYDPILTYHDDLRVIGVEKREKGFVIYSQFFTKEESWVLVEEDGKKIKELQEIYRRRVLILEKPDDSKYMVLSIDPIGEGPKVSKAIPVQLDLIQETVKLNIMDFFDKKEIDKAIHKLIDDGKLLPIKAVAKEESTKRQKMVMAQTNADNISDDEIYKNLKEESLELENLRMKFGEKNPKETIEVYGKTLLKIATSANKESTDELTKAIVSLL